MNHCALRVVSACLAVAAVTTCVGALAVADNRLPLIDTTSGSPSTSAAPAPNTRAVSLREAVMASRQAPSQQRRNAQQDAATQTLAAAGGWPATSVGAFSTWRSARIGVTAAVPLPILGIRRTHDANVAVASAERRILVAENLVLAVAAQRNVSRAWLEIARAEARATHSQRAAQRQQRLADIAQQRFIAGDVGRVDAVQADAARRLAMARATLDRAAIAAASAELAGMLGWDADTLLHADGELPGYNAVPALATIRQLRDNHPLMVAQHARTTAQSARVELASAAAWPRAVLDTEAALFDVNAPGNDLRVGLTLELPLWGRTSQLAQAARAQQRVTEFEAVVISSALDGEIVAAYRRFEAARDQATTLARDVVPAAAEGALLAREAYAEGSGGLLPVLEAERVQLEVELAATDARIDAAQGQLDVLWTSGHFSIGNQP